MHRSLHQKNLDILAGTSSWIYDVCLIGIDYIHGVDELTAVL